jgi:PKD repeat protein
MKRFTFLVTLLLVVSLSFVFPKATKVSLVSSSADETVVKFEVKGFDFETVQTPKGNSKKLMVPRSGRMLKRGAPDLTKLATSIIIPDDAQMTVDVTQSKFTDHNNIDIAPSKGNLLRNVDPATVPYEYGVEYQTNAFFPGKLAELGSPYIARDYRGQSVTVYPFQYNPVTKVLRVYSELTVRISSTGVTGKNVFVRKKARGKAVREFDSVYSRQFINYDAMTEATLEYTALNDPIGNYLIICYSDFMDEMANFVTWKQSIGYNVDLVDYSTIGSSTALKTYVANYYNTNGLTYLLLVGDNAQVPTSSTSAGDSDNNYGYIVGSDHYLDIFVGRFSAETSDHVTTQVNRTIYYEQSVLSTATWFNHAIGMGSSEGPGHDGEYDYVHINNILSDLAGYGYTTHECHQSGGSATLMSSLINNGAGTIFYCGHGTVTSWYTSSWQYTSTHVNALTNENELPFIYSVACVVGDFKNNTCYCETWQRATNNGNPTGSVAHAGSTINQSWIPPMDAEDEMADILVASSGPNRTFGGTFVNGMFKMIDLNGSGGESMADTWTCFGDPSVQLRTPGTPNGPVSGGNIPPNANFTFTTNLLQATFTDSSTDSDGTVVSWSWNFGDGNTSTLQNPIHTYSVKGTYSVSLTVTDDEGATRTVTKSVNVTDGLSPEVYVDSIAVSVSRRGRRYTGNASIYIKDTDNNFVSNATVYISWSGAASGTASAVTDASGKVTFTSASANTTGPFTITVTNVTHGTLDYNASLNNETTDSGSY